MPNKTNLIGIVQTPAGKTVSQNITYVNPNAAESDLTTFASAFYSLSNNTLVGLDIVERRELTLPEPEPAVALLTPSITVTFNGNTVGDSFEIPKNSGYSQTYFDVARSGNGVIAVSDTQGWMTFDSSASTINQSFGKWEPNEGDSTVVTVSLASDGTYDTGTKVFTVTYTAQTTPLDDPEVIDP